MEKDIVLIDLFSGAGGFHKGLEQAGFNIIKSYFSEIDVHAIANYKYNFPNAEYIGSVLNISGHTIRQQHPNATIIVTGGFPCQDISIAGKRKGIEVGTRSGLFFELVRVIAESRCQYFIAENVKGLSSIGGGDTFYQVLKFLSSPSQNGLQYNVEVQLLNTSWLLPQNRERFFFVGSLTTGGGTKVFPITENDCRAVKGAKLTSDNIISGGW